jgi:hypothetical protein
VEPPGGVLKEPQVHSVGEEPPGRGAPVDLAGQWATALPLNDPLLSHRCLPLAGDCGWTLLSHLLPPCRWSVRFHAAHRDQRQAEVADPGEQAVERGLVDDRPAMVVWPCSSLVTRRPSNQADQ